MYVDVECMETCCDEIEKHILLVKDEQKITK